MPASQPQPITEVAKPVAATRGMRAPRRGVCAVMTMRVAFIGEGLGKGVVDRPRR